jgi:hypothetical protein
VFVGHVVVGARAKTHTFPAVSAATPMGVLSCADNPIPSKKPATPLPACVVTDLVAEMTRTRWLLVSATNTRPKVPTATPCGLLKPADVPTPSANVEAPPACVATVVSGEATRMRWLS